MIRCKCGYHNHSKATRCSICHRSFMKMVFGVARRIATRVKA